MSAVGPDNAGVALFVELTEDYRGGQLVRVNVHAVTHARPLDKGGTYLHVADTSVAVKETWEEIQTKANAEAERLDREEKVI